MRQIDNADEDNENTGVAAPVGLPALVAQPAAQPVAQVAQPAAQVPAAATPTGVTDSSSLPPKAKNPAADPRNNINADVLAQLQDLYTTKGLGETYESTAGDGGVTSTNWLPYGVNDYYMVRSGGVDTSGENNDPSTWVSEPSKLLGYQRDVGNLMYSYDLNGNLTNISAKSAGIEKTMLPIILAGVTGGLGGAAGLGSSLGIGSIGGGAVIGAGSAALTGGDILKGALLGGLGGAGNIGIGDTGVTVGQVSTGANILKNAADGKIFSAITGAANLGGLGNTEIAGTGVTLNDLAKDYKLAQAFTSTNPAAVMSALTSVANTAMKNEDYNSVLNSYITPTNDNTADISNAVTNQVPMDDGTTAGINEQIFEQQPSSITAPTDISQFIPEQPLTIQDIQELANPAPVEQPRAAEPAPPEEAAAPSQSTFNAEPAAAGNDADFYRMIGINPENPDALTSEKDIGSTQDQLDAVDRIINQAYKADQANQPVNEWDNAPSTDDLFTTETPVTNELPDFGELVMTAPKDELPNEWDNAPSTDDLFTTEQPTVNEPPPETKAPETKTPASSAPKTPAAKTPAKTAAAKTPAVNTDALKALLGSLLANQQYMPSVGDVAHIKSNESLFGAIPGTEAPASSAHETQHDPIAELLAQGDEDYASGGHVNDLDVDALLHILRS